MLTLAYNRDFAGSARRHLASAKRLHEGEAIGSNLGHKAVAGYLFGLAGELALKCIMAESQMKPLPLEHRRDDPFYAHFPGIQSLLRLSVSGRRSGDMMKHLNNATLFQNWSTDMRYAPTPDVKVEWVERWKAQAELLVSEIGL